MRVAATSETRPFGNDPAPAGLPTVQPSFEIIATITTEPSLEGRMLLRFVRGRGLPFRVAQFSEWLHIYGTLAREERWFPESGPFMLILSEAATPRDAKGLTCFRAQWHGLKKSGLVSRSGPACVFTVRIDWQ